MTFELELDIAANPQRVFDFVADFATVPQWYSAVRRVDRVHGTGAQGTRYLVYRDLPGGQAENEVAITSYVSAREVTFASQRGPTPFVYHYVVEPSGTGTRLTLEGSISGAGLKGPAALFAPLAEGHFKRGMRENLGQLRRILEGSR
ncbi:MAG: SRPBCC family protein [Leifsonia sp.]